MEKDDDDDDDRYVFCRCLTERLSCSTGLKHDVSQSSILIDGQNEIIINKRRRWAGEAVRCGVASVYVYITYVCEEHMGVDREQRRRDEPWGGGGEMMWTAPRSRCQLTLRTPS